MAIDLVAIQCYQTVVDRFGLQYLVIERLPTGDLKLVDVPKPEFSNEKVPVRMTAAAVTPLDHTILSGQYPSAKAPLVLGNEGAGVRRRRYPIAATTGRPQRRAGHSLIVGAALGNFWKNCLKN